MKAEQQERFSLVDPVWKIQPFEHQLVVARWHYERLCSGDTSDVGVGKTAPVIACLRYYFREGTIKRALIVCPNSILENWKDEIGKWSNLKCEILWGTKAKRLEALNRPAHVYIINYEGLRVLRNELAAIYFDAVICDEAHHIKNYRAQQTKAVMALSRRAKVRKALTGTVITNSIEDAWAIAEFVNPRIFQTNFWGFRNRYMQDVNAGKKWLNFPDWRPRPGAVERVKEALSPYFIRFEKKDVNKFLPPVMFERRQVQMGKEQSRIYKELKNDFIADLDKGEVLTATEILERVLKLLQITGGFFYRSDLVPREGDKPFRFEVNPKLTELLSVLSEIGGERTEGQVGERAMIWATFREEIAIIRDALGDSCRVIQGGKDGTPVEERLDLVKQFNSGEFSYLIANAATAGEGLTILCPYVVYYSRNYNLSHRIQSLGRHHRKGAEQWDKITVIDLIASDTLDVGVLKALEEKADLLKNINPRSMREML